MFAWLLLLLSSSIVMKVWWWFNESISVQIGNSNDFIWKSTENDVKENNKKNERDMEHLLLSCFFNTSETNVVCSAFSLEFSKQWEKEGTCKEYVDACALHIFHCLFMIFFESQNAWHNWILTHTSLCASSYAHTNTICEERKSKRLLNNVNVPD